MLCRTVAFPGWLCAALLLTVAARADGDSQLFSGLIPGDSVTDEELSHYHGRGVDLPSFLALLQDELGITTPPHAPAPLGGAMTRLSSQQEGEAARQRFLPSPDDEVDELIAKLRAELLKIEGEWERMEEAARISKEALQKLGLEQSLRFEERRRELLKEIEMEVGMMRAASTAAKEKVQAAATELREAAGIEIEQPSAIEQIPLEQLAEGGIGLAGGIKGGKGPVGLPPGVAESIQVMAGVLFIDIRRKVLGLVEREASVLKEIEKGGNHALQAELAKIQGTLADPNVEGVAAELKGMLRREAAIEGQLQRTPHAVDVPELQRQLAAIRWTLTRLGAER